METIAILASLTAVIGSVFSLVFEYGYRHNKKSEDHMLELEEIENQIRILRKAAKAGNKTDYEHKIVELKIYVSQMRNKS